MELCTIANGKGAWRRPNSAPALSPPISRICVSMSTVYRSRMCRCRAPIRWSAIGLTAPSPVRSPPSRVPSPRALPRAACAVLKHIPGHGRAAADSHARLPVVNTQRAVLETTDFAAFRPLAGLPMAMTAHVVFTALDPVEPATVSATIVRGVIRDSIGFRGLLMSDDISMGALSGSLAERTRAAIAAGCDVVLHCNGTDARNAGGGG